MAKTFYDIFEVGSSATPDEIRAAYKRMVQRHHPDKHRGHASSEELLKAINYAYSILSDPRKRANYDAKLASSVNEGDSAATTNGMDGAANEDLDEVSARSSSASATPRAGKETVPEGMTARPFNAHASNCSKISHINSWLALAMLLLMFVAVTRFFYQIATYETSDTAGPSGLTLFFGIMVGIAIASGVVWLAGKMVAYTLPLVWPMNLIFRGKVRSDLNPEHRRIASVVLVMGILLTFAVPELNLDGNKQNALAVPPVATTAPAFNKITASPATGIPSDIQSPKKTAALPPEPQPVSPLILERDAPPSRSSDRLALSNTPARPPVAEARVKPVEPEKPVALKTPPVAAVPAKETVAALPPSLPPRPVPKTPPVVVAPAVVKPAAAPPAIPVVPVPVAALPEPEPIAAPVKISSPKNIPAKKEETREETRTAQNDAPDEGSPALSVHRKRAQQGIADAQYQLGRAYEKGDGVARNYRQAETWYRKAADQGYGPAQHSLGSMYMLGKGVTMDPVSAYVWLNLAVNRNVSSSQQAIDYLVDTLTPEQLANAKRRVAKWSPQMQDKR